MMPALALCVATCIYCEYLQTIHIATSHITFQLYTSIDLSSILASVAMCLSQIGACFICVRHAFLC